MKKVGILFDLDGTLLDTAPEFTHCLNTLLSAANRDPISLAGLRAHVTRGVKGMLEYGFSGTLTEEAMLKHTEAFLTQYASQLGALTQPFPGILEFITQIESQEIPWGIVTNKHKRFALPLLQQFPVLREVPCLITGDMDFPCKPHPAPLLAACETLGIALKGSWYIGDAKADVEASHQAGLQCAIAYYGYIPDGIDPLEWKADHYFQHPNELFELLAMTGIFQKTG